MRPPEPGPAESGGHRLAHANQFPLQGLAIREIGGEGLLVADRLGRTVRLDRARVDPVGHRVEVVTVGLPHRVDQDLERQVGQVANGGDAEATQALRGPGTDPPQSPDREGSQETSLAAGFDQVHAVAWLDPAADDPRLGPLGGQLGHQLGGGHPDRARQPFLVEDAVPELLADLDRRAEQAGGAGHVEEGLVERQGLDQRGHVAEPGHDPAADLLIEPVIAGQEQGVGAELPGPGRWHGRPDAEDPGLVGGRGHHPSITGPADDHRAPLELGPSLQLDRDVEGVHVDVEDGRLAPGLTGHDRSG